MTDLISRQAAIRWVKTECNPYGNPTLDYETGIKVINHLRDMPSAEPVRHGKWIEDGYYGLPCVCSYCGTEGKREWKYCPNCGTRMEE